MAPRIRRAVAQIIEPADDALTQAVENDDMHVAEGVEKLLDDLRSVITDESKILVYRKPQRGGHWEYLNTIYPPINPDTILDELKDEYGGGEFQLKIHAKGRVLTAKRLNIAGRPKLPGEVKEQTGADVVPLLLAQQKDASSDTMKMMVMMMESQQRSADMQQRMADNSRTMIMGVITAALPALIGLMGNKTDPIQQFSAIAQSMHALNPPKEGNNITETLAMLTAMKEFVGGGDGGDDNMFTTVMKTLGPTLASAVQNMPPPQQGIPVGQQMLPNPAPAVRMSTPMLHMTTGHPADSQPQPRPGGNPLVALIREDVLYFARRGHAPDLAAEAVLALIEKAGVPENDIMALVVRFSSSADWIADLAVEGLDLTGSRPWADAFLQELIGQYTDNKEEGDATSRGGGSETDVASNAVAEP